MLSNIAQNSSEFLPLAGIEYINLLGWLTEVMYLAGIDTSYFKGHSMRGAGVSLVKSRGASPNKLVLQGDWTNATTFERHYDLPFLGPAPSDLILGQ